MASQFYSSKSLLTNLGKENGNSSNPEDVEKDTVTTDSTPDNLFLLSSTLNEPTDKNIEPNEFNETKPQTSESIKNETIDKPSDSFHPSERSPRQNENEENDEDIDETITKLSQATIQLTDSKTLDLMQHLNPSSLLKLKQLLLGSYYEENKAELIQQTKLIFRVITWNLNQLKPPKLNELAGDSGRYWASFFYAADSQDMGDNSDGLADIYTINFQETISLKSFSKSDEAIDDWVKFLLSVLNAISKQEYKCIFKTGLLGLTSILIAKSHLTINDISSDVGHIHHIEHDTVGLGYLRWANKGCISLKFAIGGIPGGIGKLENYGKEDTEKFNLQDMDDTVGKIPGINVQVLNVHLVHGEDDAQIKQRWDSWAKIEKKIGLDDRTLNLAHDHNDTLHKQQLQNRLRNKLGSNDEISTDKDVCFEGGDIDDDVARSCIVSFKFSDIEKQKFNNSISVDELDNIFYIQEATKALVICGDANYRLTLPANHSRDQVYDFIKKAAWNELIKYDQLSNQMKDKNVMIGIQEAPINFAPTFKVITDSEGEWVDSSQAVLSENDKPTKRYRKPVPGTVSEDSIDLKRSFYLPRYDSKRLPAYTDRILYTERPYFDIISGTYTSIPLKGSDHIPVAASYMLDAPLVIQNKLQQYKGRFSKQWNDIINNLKFMSFEENVQVSHNVKLHSSLMKSDIPSGKLENKPIYGGQIVVDAIAGETITLDLKIKNLVDEDYNVSVVEQTGSGWFGTKIEIDCYQFKPEGTSRSTQKNSSCIVKSHDSCAISFSLTSNSVETLERTFLIEIPEYEGCPEYRKFIALTVNVYDIFRTPFEQMNQQQFDNILQCFEFIFASNNSGMLNRIHSISSTSDFTSSEWDLVREISLYVLDPQNYTQKFIGTSDTSSPIAMFAVLYTWLRGQSSTFNIRSPRGKVFFSNIIKLIQYLGLDATDGYVAFGWMFFDENELQGYLN